MFLLGSEVTVVGHSLVVGVGNEIHDVLLEVVGGAGYDGEFALTYHLCQRDTEFGGTHGSRHSQHHLSASVHKVVIGLCSVHEGGRVEMAVVMSDEF